jgi:uncharacterized protein YbaR (Trm112 family)/SAM-dependent methyltransferase
MRYDLLDLVACQQCHAQLTSFTARERPSEMTQGILPGATRVAAGRGVGPVAAPTRATPLLEALAHHARGADPGRNFAVEIEEGLLICAECGRWYPIIGQLPEILPDHLRNTERDLAFYRSVSGALPGDVRRLLDAFEPQGLGRHDTGAHYKAAEMSITSKIDDPGFFGPGYTSPFNLWNPEFTHYLIALFGGVLRVLDLRRGETLLDSGCGYAWTTEWIHRSGVRAVGVDISRVYLDIGIARMGANRPHLVVGDVEHLPILDSAIDAIMAYESFHHIPDRPRAIASYDRILREGGRAVLAEPGAAHEHAKVSVDAMQKYGILERGMELDDVCGYAAGTKLSRIEQIYVADISATDAGAMLSLGFLRDHGATEGHIFRLARAAAAPTLPSPPARHRRIWPAARRRIRAALRRIGLD